MTPPIEPHDRLTEIKAIHRDYHNFYQLLRGVVLVAVLAGIGVLIFSSDLPSYWQNIYVTVVGAIGTVLIIDQRAEQRAIRQRKEELILQMGSPDNGFAIEAVRLLRQKGWLTDGSLRRARLWGANLKQADLSGANMQEVQLAGANLQGAILAKANLEGSQLSGVNLQGAILVEANMRRSTMLWKANLQGSTLWRVDLRDSQLPGVQMQGAQLEQANLQGAVLRGSYLQGANFGEANLMNAVLTRAKCDSETILPDDSTWEPDTDFNVFTDPAHVFFWRSENPYSPAYRALSESSA